MSWFTTGEIIIWLLLAAILGFILGWLLRGLLMGKQLSKLRDENAALIKQRDDYKVALDDCKTANADLTKQLNDCKVSLGDCQASLNSSKASLDACLSARGDLEAKLAAAASVKPLAPVVAPVVAPVATVRPESAHAARSLVAEEIATRTAGEGEVPKDDLDDVFGIGPVISKMLYDMGITSFRQIARFTPQDVATVESALEFFPDRIVRDDWMASAREKNIEKYGVDPLKS